MKSLLKYRSTIFLIAIAITLTFINLAFSYVQNIAETTVSSDPVFLLDKEIIIIRTPPQQKKKLPPPVPALIIPADLQLEKDHVYAMPKDLEPEPNAGDSTTVVEDPILILPIITENPGMDKVEPPVVVPPPVEDDSVLNLYQIDKIPFMGDCYGLEKAEMEICFLNAFRKYMGKNIKYPAIARSSRTEGDVFVEFIVRKTGELDEISIVRDIGGGCGDEVKRVIEGMPKWSPGIQKGRPVNVRYTSSVKFKLQ